LLLGSIDVGTQIVDLVLASYFAFFLSLFILVAAILAAYTSLDHMA